MNLNQVIPIALTICVLTFSCSVNRNDKLQKIDAPEGPNRVDISGAMPEVDLAAVKLPENFKIDVWAGDVPHARSMDISEEGIVFVGTRSGGGIVSAIIDADADGKADYRYTLAEGLISPNGVAYRSGDLYVAEKQRILKFPDIKNNLTDPTFEVVYDGFPDGKQHGYKFIAFGPDGYLYVPSGAPCNICDLDEIFASITRIDVDAEHIEPEIIARGVRNTVGFDWHPVSKNLWFTDNNRDRMGDDIPDCELNELTEAGQHFGYPYWHAGDVKDPEFGDAGKDSTAYVPPRVKMGAHVAPLGMRFYKGKMFPESYRNSIFVAEHGSWDRSKKIGYDVQVISLNEDGTMKGKYAFLSGLLNDATQEVMGRPVDVMELPDGSLLVSDDFAGCIYRVTYEE